MATQNYRLYNLSESSPMRSEKSESDSKNSEYYEVLKKIAPKVKT